MPPGQGHRTGRPSKGDRQPHTIKFPRELHNALTAARLAAGYDGVTDYVVEIVYRAQAAGLWPAEAPGQARLPISA